MWYWVVNIKNIRYGKYFFFLIKYIYYKKREKKLCFVNDLFFIFEIEKNIVNEIFMIDFFNMVSVYVNFFKIIFVRV